MSGQDKISQAELEVMRLLWKSDNPMTSTQIRVKLKELKGWEKSTVLTLIKRLVEKGAICCDKEDVFYYSPIVTEQEYIDYHTQSLVNKLYNGSLKNYVLSLCNRSKLTRDDIQELKDYFDKGMDNKNNE